MNYKEKWIRQEIAAIRALTVKHVEPDPGDAPIEMRLAMGTAASYGRLSAMSESLCWRVERLLDDPPKHHVTIEIEGGVVVDEEYDDDLIELEIIDHDVDICEICEDSTSTGVCIQCGYSVCDDCKPVHDCIGLQRREDK